MVLGGGAGDEAERDFPCLCVKEKAKADTQYFMPSQTIPVRPSDVPGVLGCPNEMSSRSVTISCL